MVTVQHRKFGIGEVYYMKITFNVTIILEVDSDGHYLATCKELPEFLTDGNSFEEVLGNVPDALILTIESYQYMNQPLPAEIIVEDLELSKPKFRTVTPKGRPKKDSDDLWLQAMMPVESSYLPAL